MRNSDYEHDDVMIRSIALSDKYVGVFVEADTGKVFTEPAHGLAVCEILDDHGCKRTQIRALLTEGHGELLQAFDAFDPFEGSYLGYTLAAEFEPKHWEREAYWKNKERSEMKHAQNATKG